MMAAEKKTSKKTSPRSGVAVAMVARYGQTTSVMRDRRMRRAKDARKSWRREEWS